MIPCSWYIGRNVSEKSTTSVFRILNTKPAGSSETLVSVYQVHGVTPQMTVMSNLISTLSESLLSYLNNSLMDIEHVSIYYRILIFLNTCGEYFSLNLLKNKKTD